jgi:hypothetical protein
MAFKSGFRLGHHLFENFCCMMMFSAGYFGLTFVPATGIPTAETAWFKVIWHVLALVIPTSSIQLKLGGLTQFMLVKLTEIRKEVQCPICMGVIRKIGTVMEYLHWFCHEKDTGFKVAWLCYEEVTLCLMLGILPWKPVRILDCC